MNPGDEEIRKINRLRIMMAVQNFERSGVLTYYDSKSKRIVSKKDKSGFLTFMELLKLMGLSRKVLARHLAFLAEKGYLYSKNGVYRFNPEFEADFERVNSDVVAWLGSQELSKSRHAFNRFLRLKESDEGYGWYRGEIKRLALEENHKRGVVL